MRTRVFLGFLTLLAPFLAAGAAVAQPNQPLDRLLPQIRRNVPGQFLDAEGAGPGNSHYHLKWLTPDGRVMWLDADARTGRVLGQSPGRDSFDTQRPRGDEQGGPPDRRDPDRRDEGRSTNPRDDRADPSRFDNRRQFTGGDDRTSRPERNFGPRDGNERPNFGNRFERGGNTDRSPGNDGSRFGGRDFGGGSGRDFGNRNFGGGRDRRGDGR